MAEPVASEEAAVGRVLFAVLLVLVGLLDFMAAGSKWLTAGAVRGDLDAWRLSTAVLLVLGSSYFVLAVGVLRMRAWVPLFTVLLTLLVLGFGLLRFTRDAVLDLALTLIFMLAMLTNLGLLGWSYLPSTRRRLSRRPGPGSAS